ncbi:MAG: hypothetical protein D6677_07695 [Calditrichaeota bacterium]|nr:MAG: hypothetical protein D6677_07695 [Calditrichota bacterium]
MNHGLKKHGFRSPLVLVVALLFLWHCREEAPVKSSAGLPEIQAVHVPRAWNINATQPARVQLDGAHGDGPSALYSAEMDVRDAAGKTIYSGTLWDDGGYNSASGDVLAGDGVFRNRFLPADITDDKGDYTFVFRLYDKAGQVARRDTGLIVFGNDAPPVLYDFSAPDILPSASPPVNFTVVAGDPDSLTEIVSVQLDILTNGRTVLPEPKKMDISSVENDRATYTLTVDSSLAAGKKGSYQLAVWATDAFGVTSDSIFKTIELENESGRIVATEMADQVQRPSGAGSYVLVPVTARVSDPQSLADVDSVYFYSRKPEGQLANSGKPFPMVDNGLPFDINNPFTAAGDAVAGDGTYTLTTLIFNDADPGVYVFTFYMRDKTGQLSAAVSDSIEVLP